MALIKCSKCGKEISTNSDKCIHCGTSIQINDNTQVIITDYETENNISRLKMLANLLCAILIILAIILFIIGVSMDDDFTPIIVIISIGMIILGAVMPPFIKWKALILKNIYELNRKSGN